MEIKTVSEESKELSFRPYQIEVQRIKEKHGDLDQIRMKLGMSRRQICQLLLVDPSAWTRWIKTDAPAHVYQSLNWLLELKKTNPEAAGPVNLHTRVEKVEGLFAVKVQILEKQISQIETLLGNLLILQKNAQAQAQQQTSVSKIESSSLPAELTATKRPKNKPKYAKKVKKQKVRKKKRARLLVRQKSKRPLKKEKSKKPKSSKKKIKTNRIRRRNRRRKV